MFGEMLSLTTLTLAADLVSVVLCLFPILHFCLLKKKRTWSLLCSLKTSRRRRNVLKYGEMNIERIWRPRTWFVAMSDAGVGGSYTVTDGGSCQLLLSMTLTLSGSWQPPAILVTNLADAVTSLVDLVFTSVIVITAALVGMILLLEPFRLLLSWRLWGDWRMRLGSFIVEIMIFPEISCLNRFTTKYECEKKLNLTFLKD